MFEKTQRKQITEGSKKICRAMKGDIRLRGEPHVLTQPLEGDFP